MELDWATTESFAAGDYPYFVLFCAVLYHEAFTCPRGSPTLIVFN